MEVCVSCPTSVCRDVSSKSGSSIGPLCPTDYSSNDLSLNDLKASLDEYLNIEEDEIPKSGVNVSLKKSDLDYLVIEDKCKNLDTTKSSDSASKKILARCSTFPPLCEPKCFIDEHLVQSKEQDSEGNGGPSSANQCYSRSVSLPTALKPVSALKGSREKHGIPPKKLVVTWAPDVYDPTPSAVSHVPSYRNHRGRSDGRKYGKNKQKGGGKSSKGSKGKDKKQMRKNSGSTNKLKPLHEEIGVVGFSGSQAGILELKVGGSPDPFCGSSFLKESVTNLHFPVAEAT